MQMKNEEKKGMKKGVEFNKIKRILIWFDNKLKNQLNKKEKVGNKRSIEENENEKRKAEWEEIKIFYFFPFCTDHIERIKRGQPFVSTRK